VTTEVGLLNDLDELTLSFWMLMPEEQEGNRVGLIGQNDAVEYGMINPTTMQYWTPVGAVDVAFGPTLEEWTHVAVVVDGDGMRVYSNGEMIAENAGAGGAVNSGDTFNMGGDGVFDATGNFFKGSIDDVAVWNIGLSDDDIADLASGAAEPIPVSGGGSLVETVPGLIAYWPFDGDLDDAVGDSDGTAQGSTDIAFADAQFGEGIDLDGVDQFVETPAENEEMFDFQDGTGFSISAWFSVNEFSKSWQALIAKGEGNRWRVHRRGGESIMTGNGGAGDVPAGGTDVTSGEIHHLVLVSDPDGGEVRFYIDGELESTGGAPNIESNDNPMMIGENPDARNRTWAGLIDDVGIWDRPITEDEVATIWNGGSGKPLMYMTEGGAPPSMAKFIPNASGFVMNIADGATAFTDKDLKVTVGGTVIENPTITQAGGVTAIEASLPEPMAAGSEVTGVVSFSDSGGMTVRLKKDYAVPPYTVIAPGLKAESSLKGGSGFLAYATQISLSQSDSASLHGGEAGAMDQFLGLLADSETGDTWLNEADSDGLDSWTYFVEQIDVVNQTDDLDSDEDGNYVPLPSGKFSVETGHPDDILSGIEASWDDTQTDGYVNGYLALVELPAGSTTFGLNVKNGYIASIAPDFGASAGSQVGGAKKVFNVYVQEAGLYPLQILFYESAAKAYIELYSIVDGAPVLVNDSGVAGSLKAYTVKGAETGGGVEEIASTGRASIISVSPEDGATARSANVKVVVRNASTSVKEDTVKLTINGEAVDASVSKDGDLVTISYTGSAVGPNAAMLSYGESNGSGNHIAWSYDYAAIYANKAAVPTEAQGGITVHEYSGTGGSSLSNLYNDENYPDSPTRSLVAPYFEWPQTGDIEVQPAGNIWDNYGLLIMGYIHPPETGEYFFYGCSDDNMETWLSTDEDPANARLILRESGWRDPRQFQAQGSEETSGAIFLEAGKAYYVEMKKKEGGGGDNAALAWSTPSDEGMDVDVGGLPISGDHLSPYVWSGATVPELGATSPTGILGTNDYTVSVAVNNGESVKVAKFTKLEVGGENVLADAEIAYGGVSATAKVDGESDPSTEVVVLVEWNNSDGTTGSASYDFMTSPHSETALYIETEDFNYDGGEWFTFEETEGGGAYEGLGFVSGIDINNNGNASENYREGGGNHPGMADSTGFDGNRGDWDMDVDFKMGWNDGGDWYNYTRDFPETSTYYNVIARLSSGGSPPVTKLSVVTSDSTAADQTIEDLGIFSGPSTACWNCFEFYPLQDENGKKKLVKLGGVTTLRHSLVSGNHDSNYIMFVPSAVQEFPPSIVSKGAVVSAEGNADVTVVLKKMELALANEQLSINGEAIDTAVATDGDLITLTGSATALPAGPGTVTVSYNNVSESWDIEVPYTTTSNKPVNNGDGTITYAGHLAWEWWDGIDGHLPEHLNNLINDARYPGSPDGATWTTSFATRTALCCGFDGDGRNNYGGRMSGILTAPETGTYRFFLASDDASVLRISTDTDPANAVQVAHEDGCCKNFTLSDGVLSGTVDLEEGQQYYMEAIVKEGGGGDWLTVAWRKPSEDIDSVPAGGNSDRTLNSIPGKYFVGKQVIPALSAKVSPAHDAIDVAPESTITVTVSNGTTTLDVDSVSISLNGNKLEHAVAEGTGTFGTTYSITASTGRLKGGSQNSITVTLKDSAGAETTIESSFRTKSYHTVDMSKGVKYIEAEDFNYDGGSYKTFEEVGLGGSYEGLGAVTGIDFNNSGNASEQYRSIPGNHPGMTDSSWDSGRGGFSMEVDFKMGWNDDGDWYNYTRDFPEGGKYAVYGRFSSGGSDINNKLSIVTSDATAADQTIEDVGVFQGPNTGGWNNMEFFPLKDADGNLATVSISGTTTVRLTKVGGNMDANYMVFVPVAAPAGPGDISAPGDAVVASSDNSPGGEQAPNAIDDDPSTKYLNFDGANNTPSGLTITTSGGVVTGLGLTSANDAPDRDPATFVLSGSNDGGATFAEIASGDVPAFGARFERQAVHFDNSTAYTTYQLTFPTTVGPSTCCMQIAEIELLGTPGDVPGPVDGPALSIVNNGDGTITVTFEGRLEAAPTVNGPWQDSGLTSPATIPADEAQQYGRAVLD